MRRLKVFLLLIILTAGGCMDQAQNPRADLVASQKVFTATVDSLTALLQAGKFTGDESAQIDLFVHLGHGYLETWAASIKAGEDNTVTIQSFQAVLNKLIEYSLTEGGDL